MDYQAWKLFVDACEMGSLSKVAAAHGITQPQVSRSIGALEEDCHGRLFQRTGRGVALTELGKRIEPMVRTWLASTDQLVNDIKTSSGTPVGVVRVGILPSAVHPMMTTLYTRLSQEYPLVKLVVREGQGSTLDNWLDTGAVDLAIVYRQDVNKSQGEILLAESSAYVVGPARSPLLKSGQVEFRALKDMPLVLFCRPNRWRDRLDQTAHAKGFSLQVDIEADSLALQAHLMSQHGMYGILGPYAAMDLATRHQLSQARLIAPDLRRRLCLAMSRMGTMTMACRTVLEMLKEISRESTTKFQSDVA